jgi:DNA uptake protein ComE-like DNA-binding protein
MMREFFYLQKSDRKVLLALLAVIVIALGVIFLTGESTPPIISSQSKVSSQSVISNRSRTSSPSSLPKRKVERFPFDPNTADSAQLRRLGLQAWQIRNIYKFRAAGGIYRKPLDFAKLYGLTVKEYRELEPFIRISSDYQPASTLFEKKQHEKAVRDTMRKAIYPEKLKQNEQVELNCNDTNMLKKVPGVGSYYARRVVEYGKRLGGYVRVGQLMEIDGFPDEALSYFKMGEAEIQKINLNTFTLNRLKSHPYVSFFQAKAIVDYRRLRGYIKSLDDLSLLKEFPPQAIEKLKPYVEF